jgi:hypothetical protein
MRTERVLTRGDVVFPAYRWECRALPVLGVRVRLTPGHVPAFVFFSSRPRVYIVGVCFVTTREGWLSFLCRVSFFIYVASIGLLMVLRPYYRRCNRYIHGPRFIPDANVRSRGQGFFIGFFCGGSSWDIVCGCGNISAVFHYVCTYRRELQACIRSR